MTWIKRVVLFGLVNLLILLTVQIAVQVVCGLFGFHLRPDVGLWIFYGAIGMGGAFINLALSRKMAKWFLGVRLLDPEHATGEEQRLIDNVHRLAERAGLPKMPEVGIYPGRELNAFATGPSKRRSLVAVSEGLLINMDAACIDGVLGHEISHIANGDMVTMTLLQGVINTMVLILARILSSLVASQVEERSRPILQMVVFYVLQIALSLLGSLVVCYFSRAREYRADRGGAELAGRAHMLAGLRALREFTEEPATAGSQSLASLKISGPPPRALSALFATHPPLAERIRRLETA